MHLRNKKQCHNVRDVKKNDSGTNTLTLIPDPKKYFFQDKFYEIQFHEITSQIDVVSSSLGTDN